MINPSSKPSWHGSGYTKLYLWSLVEYELVFYIDADALIQSFDVLHAFDLMLKAPKAKLAAAPDVFPPDNFNAGVLVLRPSMLIFREMLQKIDKVEPYDGGDTGFLN